jgi:hypothetical protein
MTTAKQKREARENAVDLLLNNWHLKPGDSVFTTVKHVSRSGMSRSIAAFLIRDNQPHEISHLVAQALEVRLDNVHGGVVMGGCGMDMTFALVYDLSRTLFPKGHFCTGERGCPSNDHNNDYGTARRKAVDEFKAEGVDILAYVADPEARLAQHRQLQDRAAIITDRDNLTYSKGRHHSDGGYALNRRNL